NRAPGILESNVFGVQVPGSDGKAGMACLVVSKDFDLATFTTHVARELPKYARPIFLRLLTDMRVTSTLKHQKADYRRGGYDPKGVTDSLYVSLDGRYVPVTPELHERILARTAAPG